MLAETNDCVFCSQLQGKGICDCHWSGVCVAYEKYWREKGQNKPANIVRQDVAAKVLRRVQLAPTVYLLEMEIPPALAEELKRPGSFIFLRRVDDPLYFNFPVGIMKIRESVITVIVDAVGPKSRRVAEFDGGSLLARGPYFNGVFGQPWIDNSIGSNILLIAGGMGQSPALPIATKLAENLNQVVAILAPGKIGKIFIAEELQALGIEVKIVASLRKQGYKLLREYCASTDTRPDLVVSAGPDEQHYAVIDALKTNGINIPMAVTNNARMCCGEGICGSCGKTTHDGKVIKTCKVQTDFCRLT